MSDRCLACKQIPQVTGGPDGAAAASVSLPSAAGLAASALVLGPAVDDRRDSEVRQKPARLVLQAYNMICANARPSVYPECKFWCDGESPSNAAPDKQGVTPR